MSIVAMHVDPERGVYVGSDGVSYRADGNVHSYVSKVLTVPHLNCLVAVVGVGQQLPIVADLIERGGTDVAFTSFDLVVANFYELFRQVERTLVKMPGFLEIENWNSTMIIAGWSDEHQRFEAHKISNYGKDVLPMLDQASSLEEAMMYQVTPYEVQKIGEGYVSAWPGEEVAQRFGIGGSMPVLDYLARVVSAGRATSEVGPERTFMAGGFLQITALTRDKITSWIAHRWPDRLGAPVDPSSGAAMPDFPLVHP
jgi:hypothetical protein